MHFSSTGNCYYGAKCHYAHGQKDIRFPGTAHPLYKTSICKNEQTERGCPFGARCMFIHRSDPQYALVTDKYSRPTGAQQQLQQQQLHLVPRHPRAQHGHYLIHQQHPESQLLPSEQTHPDPRLQPTHNQHPSSKRTDPSLLDVNDIPTILAAATGGPAMVTTSRSGVDPLSLAIENLSLDGEDPPRSPRVNITERKTAAASFWGESSPRASSAWTPRSPQYDVGRGHPSSRGPSVDGAREHLKSVLI